jgi:hypothetical protein
VQVLAAEERAALMEAEVREEVSNEMADLLREMEANYRVLRITFYTFELAVWRYMSRPIEQF